MSRRVLKQGIKGDDGEVTVEHGRDSGEIEVRWTCGDTYHFMPKQVEEAIHYIEDFGNQVWVALKDSTGNPFQATLVNNRLFVRTKPSAAETGGIPWNHLKDVLTEALQQGDQQGSPASP